MYLLYLLINVAIETFFTLHVSMNENELDISIVRVAAPVVCYKSAPGCHNYPRWVHSAQCSAVLTPDTPCQVHSAVLTPDTPCHPIVQSPSAGPSLVFRGDIANVDQSSFR